MHPIILIARNGVRESLRRRVLYLIVLFIIAFVVMLESAARFEAQLQVKMIKDFSYTIVSFFGLLVVLISTFDQIPNEVDSKTIYLPLARAMPRRTIVVGKYFGILAVLTMFLGLMLAVLMLAIKFGGAKGALGFDAQLAQGFMLLWMKYACWAALLLMMSVVTSRPLAVTLSIFVYFYGHVNDFLERAAVSASGAEGMFDQLIRVANIVLPKFSLLDPPGSMIYARTYSWSSMGIMALYAASFSLLYLLIASWAFSRKEL